MRLLYNCYFHAHCLLSASYPRMFPLLAQPLALKAGCPVSGGLNERCQGHTQGKCPLTLSAGTCFVFRQGLSGAIPSHSRSWGDTRQLLGHRDQDRGRQGLWGDTGDRKEPLPQGVTGSTGSRELMEAGTLVPHLCPGSWVPPWGPDGVVGIAAWGCPRG